jgi:hypothetical protein
MKKLMKPTVDCPLFRQITARIFVSETKKDADKAINDLVGFIDNWVDITMLELKQELMNEYVSKLNVTLATIKASPIDEEEEEIDPRPQKTKKVINR